MNPKLSYAPHFNIEEGLEKNWKLTIYLHTLVDFLF